MMPSIPQHLDLFFLFFSFTITSIFAKFLSFFFLEVLFLLVFCVLEWDDIIQGGFGNLECGMMGDCFMLIYDRVVSPRDVTFATCS